MKKTQRKKPEKTGLSEGQAKRPVAKRPAARKKAASPLVNSEEGFRQLVENIREAFWIRSQDTGEMLYISPAYEEIWGKTGLSHERTARDEIIEQEYRIIRPDQSIRWIRDRSFPIRNASGRVYRRVGIAEDITEKVRLRSDAIRSAKLASIGELAAGVAHEINNPINSIINYSRIIMDRSVKGSPENEMARRAMKEGRRIATIIKSLLSFSSGKEREKQPLDIHEIISELLLLAKAQILKDGIGLKVRAGKPLPMVNANPNQIKQVFLNILNNARYALNRKYPETGKDKEMEVLAEEIQKGGISHVRISFFDRGTGMPSRIIGRVMEPFFSTKPPGEGTGLGLSICADIIAEHGGEISVESKEGEFTRVVVELPAVAPPRPN